MSHPAAHVQLAIDGGDPIRSRPFARTCFVSGNEKALIEECLESGHWSGFRAGGPGGSDIETARLSSRELAEYGPSDAPFCGGKFVRELEALFAEATDTRYAVSANSATSGLAMALGAIGIEPGDEVLVPCMSFHASATSVLCFDAVPVFVEVDPGTLCMDPEDAASKITDRTRAILPVHLSGNAAGMDAIMALAGRHSLSVVEDCAQALGVSYRGRTVGSIGDAGVYSLTETKNITCGEGGVVVTNNQNIAVKCRLIRNHGEGIAEDSWTDEALANVIGMNYRLTELQAAIAIPQFHSLAERNVVRGENYQFLIDRLSHLPQLVPQKIEAGTDHVCFILKWIYHPGEGNPDRDGLVRAMRAEGIPLVPGYARLLHEFPLFSRRIAYGTGGVPFTGSGREGSLNYGTGACPRSERLNRNLIWFSFVHPPNTRDDMEDVARAFEKVLAT